MTIKLTEIQKERLIRVINNVKDINNCVHDTVPLEYDKVIGLDALEYFLADVFKLELPKCEHGYTDRYRDYKFKTKEK